MIRNFNYQNIAKPHNIYCVSEMDLDYNIHTEILNQSHKTSNVYSVAKTFTATAIGMCVDQGLIKVSDKFLEIMNIELPDGCDPKWHNVTVEMLLTHSAGFEGMYLDIDCDNVKNYGTQDYLLYVLKAPLTKQGIENEYTDAAFYLLSRIVEKVSGQTLYNFLRPILMNVLEFNEYAWSSCPLGHTMGGTGLYIRCEDMVKLGIVYLNKGTYKDTRIVSEKWCAEVLEKGYALHNYGNGWYVKGGMLGQFLAINTKEKISVSWVGYSRTIDNLKMLGISREK